MSILNIGNTCFLSAALQCIIGTTSMDKYFQIVSTELNNANQIVREYMLIHLKVRTNMMCINPVHIYSLIYENHPSFNDNEQHDCHEAILVILNMLAESFLPLMTTLHKLKNIKAINSWCPPEKSYNIIDEIFKLQIISLVRCTRCDHAIERYQCEYSICMDDLINNSKCMPLEGYKCDVCHLIDTCFKLSQIVHFPSTLMVYMNTHLLETTPVHHNDNIRINTAVYTMYAVCKHHPQTNKVTHEEGGHYTVCVKNENNSWTLKNDERCFQINEELVMNDARIIFYERTS
jgi:ubiquitin C-terminal hydrolase